MTTLRHPNAYLGLLPIALLTAYWVAPYLFSLWMWVLPPLRGGTSIYLHLYGSSRWLTVGAVGFTWWLLYRGNSVGLWQWGLARWLSAWLVSALIVTQLLYAFSLVTDVAAWTDSGYRPFFLTEVQARIAQIFAIPINVLIGPLGLYLSVSKAGTIDLNPSLPLQPDGEVGRFPWIDWGVSLLWLVAVGWLYLWLSSRMGRPLRDLMHKENEQDKALKGLHRLMVNGWGGLLWLVTYTNTFFVGSEFSGSRVDIPELMLSLLGSAVLTLVLLGISLPFTWIYYRLVALLVRLSRGFAQQG